MNWEKIHNIYFVGIGGIGMSALARYFVSEGKQVSGYDLTQTELTKQLEKEGMQINFEDKAEFLPEQIDLVIYTPAIPASSKQMTALKERNLPIYKRAQILGLLSQEYFTIAVAGSHGKTSVSCMILHLLKTAGIDCTAILGGISSNYNSNYVAGSSNVLVVEADEYDRSFLQLSPDLAVVTSIDTDHLDIYGSRENLVSVFNEFAKKLPESGLLIQQKNDVGIEREPTVKYAVENSEGPHIANLKSASGQLLFDFVLQELKVENCVLENGALHNAENMLAAALVAENQGAEIDKIRAAVATYKGVKRRFELVYKDELLTFIDDYAHHPKEIETLIKAVRKLYPGQIIHLFFQPHLYSRTRDLADEFALALGKADYQYILPIYPARELPIEGVTSAMIAEQISNETCSLIDINRIESVLEKCDKGVVLTVGAGNIDKQVSLVKTYLQNRKLAKNQ